MVHFFGCLSVQTPDISFGELKDRQVAFTHTRLAYISCQGQLILPHPLQPKALLAPCGFLIFATLPFNSKYRDAKQADNEQVQKSFLMIKHIREEVGARLRKYSH